MRRATTIALWAQALLAVCFVVRVSTLGSAGGLTVVGLYFYYIPIGTLIALFGLWVAWRQPALRRKGLAMAALPVVALFMPTFLIGLFGDPSPSRYLLGAAGLLAAGAVALSVLAPRRVAAVIPDALFRSRLWNGLIVAALVAGWLLLAAVVIWALNDTTYRRDTGMGLAFAILLATMYMIGMGLASTGAGLWAWLGLRSRVENACRKLNVAQLVVAAPGVLLGGAAYVWYLSQGA
jgi:hypothetical protein